MKLQIQGLELGRIYWSDNGNKGHKTRKLFSKFKEKNTKPAIVIAAKPSEF